jgi:hypothetical protein
LSNAKLTNLAAGTIDIQSDGTAFYLSSSSTLHNGGTLIKSAGTGISRIQVHFRNAGTIEIQTGALEFYGSFGLTYIQTAGQTILSGGDLDLVSNAAYALQGGELLGIGTVNGPINNSGGAVMPGLSAGVLTIDGNYTQGANATLAIEIGGTAQGLDYDWLDVTGNGALAGTLEVTLIDGFIPNPGDMFEVVTAGAITGVLDSVVFTNPPGNLDLSVTYAANSVTIQTIGSVPGDCDGDGDVDLADYACFLDCLTGPDGGLLPDCGPFDFDSDSDVDLRDLAIFQEVFVQ